MYLVVKEFKQTQIEIIILKNFDYNIYNDLFSKTCLLEIQYKQIYKLNFFESN